MLGGLGMLYNSQIVGTETVGITDSSWQGYTCLLYTMEMGPSMVFQIAVKASNGISGMAIRSTASKSLYPIDTRTWAYL